MRHQVVCIAALLALAAACGKSEPPRPDPTTLSPSVSPLPASAATLPIAGSAAPAAVDAGNDAATDAGTWTDPGKLPQTKDKPVVPSPGFDAHVALLWSAIVEDAPEKAMPFFFPVDAYAQIKDIPNPGADWKARLVRAYTRDIHALHKRLGDDASQAKFLRIEVPSERAKWVPPHEELNTGSYWRVFGTRVYYEDGGKERSFEISSLISWRGEWYVVHLSGFK